MDISKIFTLNRLAMLVVILVVGGLFKRYKNKFIPDEELSKQKLIHKYLLTDEDVIDEKKPMLWIHTNHEVNSRQWLDFMTRNTKLLNQNYIECCVKTIINHNSEDFNICLIDDNSFEKIIPNWTVDMTKLADPIKSHMRTLALLKVLDTYGGFLCPNSAIAMKSFRQLYGNSIHKTGMFVGEIVSRNSTSSMMQLCPSTKIIAANKGNQHLRNLMRYCELLISKDSTNEMDFEGNMERKLFEMHMQKKIHLVNGRCLGTKDRKDNAVLVDHLLSDGYIEYDNDLVLVYLPSEEILRRNKFNWFVRLNKEQLKQANTMASKILLMSHAKKPQKIQQKQE